VREKKAGKIGLMAKSGGGLPKKEYAVVSGRESSFAGRPVPLHQCEKNAPIRLRKRTYGVVTQRGSSLKKEGCPCSHYPSKAPKGQKRGAT